MRKNDEELRAIHLQDQAKEYGCLVETHEDNNAVFLRNVPGDLQGDKHFEQFVEQCLQHNIAAIKTWKESE